LPRLSVLEVDVAGMHLLAALLAGCLLVYLGFALLKPEKFQ